MDKRIDAIVDNFIAHLQALDRHVLRLSPNHDLFLLRLLVVVPAIVFFVIHSIYQLSGFYWLGLPFYLLCLGLYLLGLLKALLIARQVSAELLIVLVMTVTLIDGKPLSGALVAWFVGLGLFISFTIIRKNREKIESLVKQAKRTALVLNEGLISEIPVEAVRTGDMLIVPRGTVIPVDGVIHTGQSSIDESYITGEPFPVFKVEGDEVVSGLLNLSTPIQITATKDGDASYLTLVSAEIERSLQNKSTLQQRADQIVQYLLLGVTGYSFLLLLATGSLDRMATALAVICPCAWALDPHTGTTAGHQGNSDLPR